AEDHVGPVFDDRLNEPRILGGIVFEVGVLDDDHITAGVAKPFAQGGAFALVVWLVDNAQSVAFQALQDVARAVGAAIVHEDDFFGDRYRLDALQQFADPAALIVNGDHDR